MQKNFLVVSEEFYSIQGEGKSVGMPAVFLRLSGCNLRCPGFSYKHPENNEHLGCDTTHVWKRGRKKTFADIINNWQQQGWLQKLEQGAHLVITGGEPMLQQPAIIDFLHVLDQQVATLIYVEIETNATLQYSPELLQRVQQLNVSPKLANSGEHANKSYKPEILLNLAKQTNVYFKFVIAKSEDIAEVLEKYVAPFQISHERIWLMPEGGTLGAVTARMPKVIELCKQYKMNLSPRLHILIWDQATGV